MRGEPVYAQPKPQPKLLAKQKRASDLDKQDREEKAKCRLRSGGRCEVWSVLERNDQPSHVCYVGKGKRLVFRERESSERVMVRCHRRATENHHLIGGSGRRNRGRSILAEHRLYTCDRCHAAITGNVLVPCVPQDKAECAATVRYERVKRDG